MDKEIMSVYLDFLGPDEISTYHKAQIRLGISGKDAADSYNLFLRYRVNIESEMMDEQSHKGNVFGFFAE